MEASLAATRYAVFAAENPAMCNDLRGDEFDEFFESGAVRVVRQPDSKGRKVIAIALAKIPAAADGLRLSRCLLYTIDRLGRDVQFQARPWLPRPCLVTPIRPHRGTFISEGRGRLWPERAASAIRSAAEQSRRFFPR